MHDKERHAWLRLARTENVGPVTFRNLIARFGSAAAALEDLPRLAARGGGKNFVLPDASDAARELEALAKLGGRMIASCEGGYPHGLAALEAPPPVISVLGHPHLLQKEMIAIVGARNASALARKFADTLSRELGFAGLVVVSGLARGIDTAAHRGALDGGTIGVVASGLDIVYPPENEGLQREMQVRGLVVSEQPPGTEPHARHFPARNRIIAGLALGTLVVEAAPKSGSLITARLAADYGREVMAVPGSPLDPRAQGCNQLIRDGATLIQSAADVAEAVRPFGSGYVATSADAFTPGATVDVADRDRQTILSLLSPIPVAQDELLRQSDLTPAALHLVLLELELAGRLVRHAGGRVALD